ncbi:MAG TPA: Ku protein [Mycobacteriales bacterium]|nr:Ku protein [Mycobacteriales bacterium]
MARSIWSGAINFGLVTVPVGLYSATEDHTVHFHQFERGTTDRVRNQRVNERTGKEVDYEDVVKGRELRNGKLVLVEQQELDDIAPGRSRTIDITGFVALEEIDPIYFQRSYYLAPRGAEYARTYDLLRQALERSGRAGIALFVMRGKQYLTLLRPAGRVLMLETMYFADEIRDPRKELDLPAGKRFSGTELDTSVQLVEAMSMEWKPSSYQDSYAKQVEKLVRAKGRGKAVTAEAEPPEATNVVDLMEALQQSVAGSKKSRGKKSRGGEKLSELSKKELYDRASSLNVKGRSSMSRKELESAVGKASRSRRKAS